MAGECGAPLKNEQGGPNARNDARENVDDDACLSVNDRNEQQRAERYRDRCADRRFAGNVERKEFLVGHRAEQERD